MRWGGALIKLSFGLCRTAASWAVEANFGCWPVEGEGEGGTEALAATAWALIAISARRAANGSAPSRPSTERLRSANELQQCRILAPPAMQASGWLRRSCWPAAAAQR